MSVRLLDQIFFENNDLNKQKVFSQINKSLHGMDDGELYLEFTQSESLVFDDNHLKNASFNTSSGFGLRGVIGDRSAYSYSSDLSLPAIIKAGNVIGSLKSGKAGKGKVEDFNKPRKLYSSLNPLEEISFKEKVKLLEDINQYLRAKDKRVKQVSVSLSGEWQAIDIIRPGGKEVSDIRPLVRLNISVIVEENGRMERGSYGAGGRQSYEDYFAAKSWKAQANEALRQAVVNLKAVPAPAGEMDVVLGPGWPGVMLHEAVGHGLEGDFNRKKTSVFSGQIGEQVAAKGVTVIDDGTIDARRGSLNIDDEGTKTGKTVLIEDGKLVGYMQDRMNSRLMKVKATGNGRRESYQYQPMPRMTNTFMMPGKEDPKDIIKSVKKGIYAVNFGGGQVDITSGKFVFSASEAYKIENGKIGAPVKGATLIGNGPEAMRQVKAIGNDLKLDAGVGTCGKDAQSVPVGVGQPTLLMSGLTVGGTEV